MEEKRIKIGVLTSGGDAPGMNAAIRAIVRAGDYLGAEIYGIKDGYKGMFEAGKYIFRMTRNSVTDIITRGGTVLGTARMKEFVKDENRLIAINNLKQLGINFLITIGGDGTYQGAKRLIARYLKCSSTLLDYRSYGTLLWRYCAGGWGCGWSRSSRLQQRNL